MLVSYTLLPTGAPKFCDFVCSGLPSLPTCIRRQRAGQVSKTSDGFDGTCSICGQISSSTPLDAVFRDVTRCFRTERLAILTPGGADSGRPTRRVTRVAIPVSVGSQRYPIAIQVVYQLRLSRRRSLSEILRSGVGVTMRSWLMKMEIFNARTHDSVTFRSLAITMVRFMLLISAFVG